MPASGVAVNDCCVTTFKDIKENKKLLCVIYGFKMNESGTEVKEIIPLETYEKKDFDDDEETAVNSILQKQMEDLQDPIYILWDLKLPTKSSADAKTTGACVQKTETLVFTGLCLDSFRIQKKMMFASSVKSLLDVMPGIPKKTDLRCCEDCNYKHIIENAK